jgi:hypothetical protein
MKKAIGHLDELRKAIAAPSPRGYCSGTRTTLMGLSNRRLCKSGGTNRNIGFYYKVIFPVDK